MSEERFHLLLSDAVRSLDGEADLPHTLQRLVKVAGDFFPDVDFVGVSLVEQDAIRTVEATNDRIRELDEAQFDLGQGPCRESIRMHETVLVDDLGSDPRWPEWGELMVRELGVRSSLSFRLFVQDDHTWGALNLYSTQPHAFTREDVFQGQTIAAMAAVALATSIQDEQLARGLETRATIGQATGILMERFSLTPDAAFEVLRRLSSQQNVKLRDIAADVVRTRTVPGTADPD